MAIVAEVKRRLTKAEKDRKAMDASWEAERLRVKALEDAFAALPNSPAKTALLGVMTSRVIELYNASKFEEGDILLEFMPRHDAMALLDWYFDDPDPDSIFTPPTPPAEHEAAQPGQVQDRPQGCGGPHRIGAGEADAEQEASRLSVVAAEPAGADRDESRAADIVAIAGDLVALWQNQTIQGLPRADRNAAIEETRNRLIAAVNAQVHM